MRQALVTRQTLVARTQAGGGPSDRLELLSAQDLGRTLDRLASQVLEAVADSRDLVLLGPNPCFIDHPPDYIGGFQRAALEGLLTLMDQNTSAGRKRWPRWSPAKAAGPR